jgi:dihydroflavonol-4-reductase
LLVSITGGSGFVGAHSTAAIVEKGHRVRLLVRDAEKADQALAPFGVDRDAVELIIGDVLDEISVGRAVKGADAVLHAASVYSFDSRRHAEMRAVNERGTEIVLDAARRSGVGRIVYVSSVVAMFPAENGMIDENSPVGRPRETYMETKAAAETVARRRQDEGDPIMITYPPALLGPHDPHLGDQNRRLRDALRGLLPMWPTGGFPVGDVRDTAALHAALLTAETGANRFFGPSRYLSTRDYVRTLRETTGRLLPAVFLPARLMLPVGRLADLAQRFWPWHIPAEYGAIYTCACATRPAEGVDTLGIEPRPVAETVGDTVQWLRESGCLSARQAGRGQPRLSSASAAR